MAEILTPYKDFDPVKNYYDCQRNETTAWMKRTVVYTATALSALTIIATVAALAPIYAPIAAVGCGNSGTLKIVQKLFFDGVEQGYEEAKKTAEIASGIFQQYGALSSTDDAWRSWLSQNPKYSHLVARRNNAALQSLKPLIAKAEYWEDRAERTFQTHSTLEHKKADKALRATDCPYNDPRKEKLVYEAAKASEECDRFQYEEMVPARIKAAFFKRIVQQPELTTRFEELGQFISMDTLTRRHTGNEDVFVTAKGTRITRNQVYLFSYDRIAQILFGN